MKKYLILFLLLLTIPASANFYTHYAIPSFGPLQTFSGIPASESAALVDFYTATAGDSWTNKTGWSGGAASSAFGVTVSGGHVTEISMGGDNNLVGDVSTTLADLPLTTLDLGQNTGITGIDLSGNDELTTIDLADIGWATSVSVAVLGTIDSSSVSGCSIDVGGTNGSPNPTGWAYIVSLTGKSCTLTYSTVAKFTPSGTLKIATKDGEAMLFDSSDNYAPYAGSDTGSTGYYAVLRDSSVNYAYAYTGAIGGGEALGADILAGLDFTSGWVASNATISDANTFVTTAAFGLVAKVDVLTAGSIYKASMQSTTTGGNVLLNDNTNVEFGRDDFSNNYMTAGGTHVRFRCNLSGKTVDIDSGTMAKLTDVPATGIHLMSAKDGTTRNLAGKDTGFNPNAVNQVEIFPEN